jgi:hypothetical protein
MRVVLVWATLTSVASGIAGGQELSVLLGGSHARYANSVEGTAALAAARLQVLSSRAVGVLDGSFSQFTTGEWATQFYAYGSAMLPLTGNFGIGVLGNGRLNNFEGGLRSGIGTLGPRIGITAGRTFVTLNGLFGGVRSVDQIAAGVLTATMQIETLIGRHIAIQAGVNGTTSDTTEYVDAVGGIRFVSPKILFSLTGGLRAGDLADDPWGQFRVDYTPSWRFTFEGAAGRYPQDLVGFTDGIFASLGIRVRIAGPSSTRRAPALTPVISERMADGRQRIAIRYKAPGERLAIAGDWNDWTPLPLVRGPGDTWVLTVRLPPGLYRFSLVVDGDRWVVPEGVALVADDFGGQVGLLLVR